MQIKSSKDLINHTNLSSPAKQPSRQKAESYIKALNFQRLLNYLMPDASDSLKKLFSSKLTDDNSDDLAIFQTAMKKENFNCPFDIDESFVNAYTLLDLAASLSALPIVKLLVRLGADVSSINTKGESPIMFALHSKADPTLVCNYLLNMEANPKRTDGWTPLTMAAYSGHAQIVKNLLIARATTETALQSGATAMWIAAQTNHPAIIKLLCDHGAKVDAVDLEGVTPLWKATKNGNYESVLVLLECKANPNFTYEKITPTLCLATFSKRKDIVELLVESGADIDGKPTSNPLYFASKGNNMPIVIYLLSKGANPNIPLQMCPENQPFSEEMATILLEASKNFNKPDTSLATYQHGLAGSFFETVPELPNQQGPTEEEQKKPVYTRGCSI